MPYSGPIYICEQLSDNNILSIFATDLTKVDFKFKIDEQVKPDTFYGQSAENYIFTVREQRYEAYGPAYLLRVEKHGEYTKLEDILYPENELKEV